MGDPLGLSEMARERFTVSAAGHRLQVERLDPGVGDAAAPTLVFLHEGLGSIAQWKDFPAALSRATGLPALVYERWGFGQSEPLTLPRPLDYLSIEAEAALPEVLAACGVERPVLVGHSDGGTIALLYAAAFPSRPAACITEAAHVFVEDISLQGIREAVRLWREGDLADRLARYHGDEAETVFRGWAETWLDPRFATWNMLDALPKITCALLALQGEGDEYGSPRQVTTIVEGVSGPAQALMIPDCGHIPHHQQRAASLSAMRDFLRAQLAD